MVTADNVFILSAMKHVGLAEAQVQACVNTNIVGTMNVINESLITKPKVLVFISSDKAAQPNGVYGCSKKMGERLMVEAEKHNPDTQYRVVRYGNVLYSTGSVLCKWRDKMKAGEEVIVTDADATRFFWPVSDAVDLIFDSINNGKDATPIVTEMKSIRIGDLLEAMMEKYGEVPIKTIGLQPGENKHEVIADGIPDSYDSERFTKNEILEFI
jgi:FlaA1/EpsC-like NDP-sugar epimerase